MSATVRQLPLPRRMRIWTSVAAQPQAATKRALNPTHLTASPRSGRHGGLAVACLGGDQFQLRCLYITEPNNEA